MHQHLTSEPIADTQVVATSVSLGFEEQHLNVIGFGSNLGIGVYGDEKALDFLTIEGEILESICAKC